MTALGLRPSRRLGLSPTRRRLSTPPSAPAGSALLAQRMGEVIARGGSLETPAASFLGGPGDAGPFDQLEIAMMATIGVTSAMASVDQPELIARPPAHWSV